MPGIENPPNFFEALGQLILEQEKQSHEHVAREEAIPKEIRGVSREYMESIGFIFGARGPLFISCKLPDGWTKRPTNHSMHTDLVDEKGRRRASIFYKASLHDRKADLGFVTRYVVDAYRLVGDGREGKERIMEVCVMDAGKVLRNFGQGADRDFKAQMTLKTEAEKWLDKTFPKWENCEAYWDTP